MHLIPRQTAWVSGALISNGRLFQRYGAATEKARHATLDFGAFGRTYIDFESYSVLN